MTKQPRKIVNLNEQQYEIIADYAESKGITMGQSIEEMQKEIDLLKSREIVTLSDNAVMFCDQVDALAECGRLPEWLVTAIKTTIRPIVLKGMLGNKDIDFQGLKSTWKIPQGMRFIAAYEKDSMC